MIHHHFRVRCRFDRAGKKGILNGYFLWLTVGYAVGKCLIHTVLHYISVERLDASAIWCVSCGIAYAHILPIVVWIVCKTAELRFCSHPDAGLFLTYLALFLMDGHGQPALLYLVPCTLGNFIYTSILTYSLCCMRDWWVYHLFSYQGLLLCLVG
jgi:hypothetical protein